MRTLSIIIDEWGRVKTGGFAGHTDEHNAVNISAEFEAVPEDCEYFRMFFSSDGRETVKTNPLYARNGKIYYSLPQSVTSLGSRVAWQLAGYKNVLSSTTVIWKTDVVTLDLGNSLSDTTLVAQSEIGSTVEKELKDFEDFLADFDISATLVEGEEISFSCQKNGNKYELTLVSPYSSLAKREQKNQSDFTPNNLFGNHYKPTDKTGEYIKIERVGNMVTVSGTVVYDPSLDRGHTETGNTAAIIYLPYKPAQLCYVSGVCGASPRYMYLSPTTSSLIMTSTSQKSGETVRLCFTYICEDE